MPRLNRVEDVMFPVEEHPVFAHVQDGSGERRVTVPDKKAIVNMNTDRVLGIVSRGYRLVTNREALHWARQCCQTTFPETKQSEWKVNATDAPGTGGHCFIDLVHNSSALDFQFVLAQDRPDAFGPFIRVTNSYNGLRALAFEIGFHRKVCKNGLILPESIIRFKFSHMQKDIGNKINFEVAHERLSNLKNSFIQYLSVFRDCEVKFSEFEPLFYGVLQIKKNSDMKPHSSLEQDWFCLSQSIFDLCTKYKADFGENAYAVFNAITEFASHPPENKCLYRDRHSLQRLAGNWMNSFSKECREPKFSISDYLEKLTSGKNGDAQNENPKPGTRPWQ
jgi:hypothetical protein